ncbi:MAG: hydantoinase/oxoprolinase family protein [Clostridia bacterium]|nr:hydantoinase/oxoprolinase family protein [Clostridia bacterium]
MKIGLGIDTGGTYTDAVLYEFTGKKILLTAKALTTKEDLSIGISNAIDEFDKEWLSKIDFVSLSTTLATNACVEDKGWRAKLIYLGVEDKLIEKFGAPYGLPDSSEIYFLNGGVDMKGAIKEEPDWQALREDMPGFLSDADAVAIVELFGSLNPTSEKKAQEYISNEFGIPAICGHELFTDLNALKRGASTILNARLIPIIEDFIDAIKKSLKQRDINAPLVIVRSDCTLMSESYTSVRPVDTLLCGPAASVMGGVKLTGEKDSIVIDMGGTTTDIAIVQDGVPLKAKDGVNIGKWQTFVKAVQVDTIGLGGDSQIRFDSLDKLVLGPTRVMPLCIAAHRWPSVTSSLKKLSEQQKISAMPMHEFVCLMSNIGDESLYSQQEIKLCAALANGPLILGEAAKAAGTDVYNFNINRLEREGVVARAGLTPTDLMHINGDFNEFDADAAKLGAAVVARSKDTTTQALIELVYDRIKQTMYTTIVSAILKKTHQKFKLHGLGDRLELLVEESWARAKLPQSTDLVDFKFSTGFALGGLCAPIHIFLPDVADALGASYVIPKHANVANALGAIVGNVSAISEIQVRPDYHPAGLKGYFVMGACQSYHVELPDALREAKKAASAQAQEEAIRRGAVGEIMVNTTTDESSSEGICLEIKVTARAVGGFAF